MWIFAGGMFRSGSTLQYQIVAELVERTGLGARCEWMMPEGFAAYCERLGPGADEPAPHRVFKTHVCKHPMRERLLDGRARAVRCHRDLRDVVVSGAQKAGVEPTPGYAREVIEGNLACDAGWPTGAGVRSWSYERLRAETAEVTLEMASFLDLPCDPAQAAELAEQFEPGRQRARIEAAIRDGRMKPAVPGGEIAHAEGDLLHPEHLRDGLTGKWRVHLGEEAVEVIESLAGDWLLAHGYATSEASRGGVSA